jgi:hypothetical protein
MGEESAQFSSLVDDATGAMKESPDNVGFFHLNPGPTTNYNRFMESKLIKNGNFRQVAADVKPDSKKRIILAKDCLTEGVTYHIYCNEIGQIILDPHISIPASEIWLLNNPEAREAVATGLQEAAAGKISRVNLDEL